jgi:DNA-binding CsgD family transcriptional regulator
MKSASPTVATVANEQRQPWRDDDALTQPGQALSAQELAHLKALANGNAPSAITAINGTSRAQQQQLESTLRAKLGAVSKPHIITRAPRPSRSPVSSQRNVRSHRAIADAYALPSITLKVKKQGELS